jgi:adenylyltransferase/sulfurtransferase
MGLRIPLHDTPSYVPRELLQRQARTALVPGIGDDGVARLTAARVLVIGAGGLGSPVLGYLAAAGVGWLGICDSDAVEISNLQRQIIHDESSVGTSKTVSAAAHVGQLNSGVRVAQYPRVTPELLDAVGPQFDLVMDCTDTFESKYLIADWCADHATPQVWASVVAMTFQVSVFWSAAPSPYLPSQLRDLYPVPPAPGSTPSSATAGVLGSVAGQAGAAMATEAVKLITGAGEPLLGRLLMSDAGRGRYQVISFRGER